MTTPSRAAERLVRWATYALPAGPARDRYGSELEAELHDLDHRAQWAHALRFALRSWALRRALGGADSSSDLAAPAAKPWPCRLHLRHRDRMAFTEDGGRYLRCIDCGRDSPHGGGRTNDSAGWAGAVNANNL